MPHTLKDVLPVTAEVNEAGHLEIGGCDTLDLAREFGTPLFVFCEETFRRRAQEFSKAFPESTVYYAGKAFLCLAICQIVEQEGLGLDVASGGELHTALKAGFPPERIILHGNNKLEADLARAVDVDVGRIALDNLEEVARVADLAAQAGKRQPVLLRVTPGVEAHTHEYVQTGQEDSKFGLPIVGGVALNAATQAAASDYLDLVGVHAHIGSSIFSYDPFAKTIEVLFEFLADVKAILDVTLEEVNLGGGIGIPYVAGDFPAQLDLIGNLIRETAEREAGRNSLPHPRLAFEPGRFLVGNSTVTLYTVGAIKEIPGIRTYVSVDGGMSDNIRPALYGARYSAILANRARDEPDRLVTIAGMHCESGDVLIKDVALPSSLVRGDVIAVPATGAYGYGMASNYNMQPRPAMVLARDGNAHVIVERESFDDLIRLHRPLP